MSMLFEFISGRATAFFLVDIVEIHIVKPAPPLAFETYARNRRSRSWLTSAVDGFTVRFGQIEELLAAES